MTTRVEIFYQMRKKYRRAHVFGLSIFTSVWIARSIYKVTKLNMEELHLAIFLILLLSLAYMAYYAIRLNIIERKIKREPLLREALHDELFRLNVLKALKTAFFSVIGFNVLAAIVSLFINNEVLMLIFITILLIGFGSYSLTLFILER
jgi:hypothetical protein